MMVKKGANKSSIHIFRYTSTQHRFVAGSCGENLCSRAKKRRSKLELDCIEATDALGNNSKRCAAQEHREKVLRKPDNNSCERKLAEKCPTTSRSACFYYSTIDIPQIAHFPLRESPPFYHLIRSRTTSTGSRKSRKISSQPQNWEATLFRFCRTFAL